MSDKHTDAQGELQAALERTYPLADGAVNPELDDVILERREGFREGWRQSRRATEGQAQTSAANLSLKTYDKWSDAERKAYLKGQCDAAQLADSTAPGAPELLAAAKAFYNATVADKQVTISSLHQEKRDIAFQAAESLRAAILAAPTAQQSIPPMSKEWCLKMAQLETESGVNIEAGAAQQSLTAGGAVPEGDDTEFLKHWDSVAHEYRAGSFGAAYNAARAAWFAAAPLPQVQSEALEPEAGNYKLAPGEKIFYSRLGLSSDGLPFMTDSGIHSVWDIAMVFKPGETRPSEVFRERFYQLAIVARSTARHPIRGAGRQRWRGGVMTKNEIPKQCKACASYWPHGIKDGKNDRWCCHFGKPAPKAISHCRLHNGFQPKSKEAI